MYMNPFTKLLGGRKATLFKFPSIFPMPEDPLSWAFKIASRDPLLKSTVMLSALQGGGGKKGMMYASRGGASKETREKLVQSASSGLPVQIQVDRVLELAPELLAFNKKIFPKIGMFKKYPCGYDVGSALFLTGKGHVYNVHNDYDDGFLFQLHGTKKVRLWELPNAFFRQTIFDIDHERHPEMFYGTPQDYILKPGYVLYFPPGMLHEISIPGPDVSVSVTARVCSLYPMVAFCKELNALAKNKNAFRISE